MASAQKIERKQESRERTRMKKKQKVERKNTHTTISREETRKIRLFDCIWVHASIGLIHVCTYTHARICTFKRVCVLTKVHKYLLSNVSMTYWDREGEKKSNGVRYFPFFFVYVKNYHAVLSFGLCRASFEIFSNICSATQSGSILASFIPCSLAIFAPRHSLTYIFFWHILIHTDAAELFINFSNDNVRTRTHAHPNEI